MKKLLIITDDFLDLGGARSVAWQQALALRDKYSVTVFTAADNVVQLDGVKIIQTKHRIPNKRRFKDNICFKPVVREFEHILEEINPDIVHGHNLHKHLSLACLRQAKLKGAKTFLTLHDTMWLTYGKFISAVNPRDLSNQPKVYYKIKLFNQLKQARFKFNPFRKNKILRLLPYIDQIFAVSDSLRKIYLSNGWSKIETLYNGIDISQWEKFSEINILNSKINFNNKHTLFFAQRLSKEKGIIQLTKAMKQIINKDPQAVLIIAGKERGFKQIITDIATTELFNKHFIFLGEVDRSTIKQVMHMVDVVVNPSIYPDPFNLVNIEAMACAKPVVGTCFGGTHEIVLDKKTGFIINPFNVNLLAEVCLKLLLDKSLRDKLGQQGFLRVRDEFSLNKQLDMLSLKFYLNT